MVTDGPKASIWVDANCQTAFLTPSWAKPPTAQFRSSTCSQTQRPPRPAENSSRTRRRLPSARTSSTNPCASRCWSISGRPGAAPASSSPRCSRRWSRRRAAGQAGQDQHRRAPADPRPARHPVDPGRLRLPARPAGRRLHGRAARKPGQGLHRAARRPARARRRRGAAEARPRRWRRPATRSAPPSSIRAVLAQDPANTAGHRRPRRCASRSGDLEGAKRLPRHGAGRQGRAIRRSPRRAPPSSSPSRRPPLGDTDELERRLAAEPQGPPGALRSRARRSTPRASARRRSTSSGHRQARPQMERGRGPQAAGAVLRGLGADGRADRRAAGASCRRHPVRREHAMRRETAMVMNAVYRGPQDCPRSHPACSRWPARCCCRAARCRSTSSSRAISRWSTTRWPATASSA